MKVLDLQCALHHVFEGWFGSEDDFQSQCVRGLVQCPLCGNASITKKLSAPRLNFGAARPANEKDASSQVAAPDKIRENKDISSEKSEKMHEIQEIMQNPEFQAAYLEMTKKILAQTEDVGSQFVTEARKMHYGESKERGIRGQASQDETMELLDEGINVMPLLIPHALKGTLQ